MTKPEWTWGQRFRFMALVVLLLLGIYVGSYASLYRRGVAEADHYGYDYFLYVPFSDVVAARETTEQHQFLGPLYHPLNELHCRWFGGRAACKCMLFWGSPKQPAP
jgi:hypothetical protein